MLRRKILVFLIILSLCGCVTAKWERNRAERKYYKQEYNYSLCEGTGVTLLVQSKPPSEQWMIDSYRITLNTKKFVVSKHSDAFFQLCPGEYDVQTVA